MGIGRDQLEVSALFVHFLWNTSQNGSNVMFMGVPFSQFVPLVLVSCLAGSTLPCYSQDGEQAASRTSPSTGVAASRQVKRPAFQLSLTDSQASLKASLWAAHVLKTTSRERLIPAEIQNSSGFAVTGPFAERSAGIRVEYAF
jgi:hypothetical protein